ncbi:MAG: secondary thiamine-phosphate synthase enzyme YjbQ [Methanosphaera sp.]|uniref:secondary thiamine-phosphate synthase enzyme YjbQ n=1 Tax=Methanosphaera sp. TaxID=2666342 RepID=UPI0025D58975|nr:secondary thiamine-phosphate synthase enzyme YjbQ [Methanosphaera sp.]MCI5866497.1 secondary thiamine-phosphate synthase enzyme YjbQ [Methanosphaera sp.]MDD6534942.1 secondary thiamine-phosphate synthase enzyme YjbQ [Methanosphaera sp.]MDY3955401.1 secondary thiamine-phosphate synthase enzyme YjbQ [Methanosphaera sp.]
MIINEKITIDTQDSVELVNITDMIDDIISENNIENGLINIQTTHTTSNIIINEDEEGLKYDFINFIKNIIPDGNYRHDMIDNNAKSHLMSMIVGCQSQTLTIVDGKLSLGIWQSIFFLEVDGPRCNRCINVTIITQ